MWFDRSLPGFEKRHVFCSQCGRPMMSKIAPVRTLSGYVADAAWWQCSVEPWAGDHDMHWRKWIGTWRQVPAPNFDTKTGELVRGGNETMRGKVPD